MADAACDEAWSDFRQKQLKLIFVRSEIRRCSSAKLSSWINRWCSPRFLSNGMDPHAAGSPPSLHQNDQTRLLHGLCSHDSPWCSRLLVTGAEREAVFHLHFWVRAGFLALWDTAATQLFNRIPTWIFSHMQATCSCFQGRFMRINSYCGEKALFLFCVCVRDRSHQHTLILIEGI